jgi:hypothetical protein
MFWGSVVSFPSGRRTATPVHAWLAIPSSSSVGWSHFAAAHRRCKYLTTCHSRIGKQLVTEWRLEPGQQLHTSKCRSWLPAEPVLWILRGRSIIGGQAGTMLDLSWIPLPGSWDSAAIVLCQRNELNDEVSTCLYPRIRWELVQLALQRYGQQNKIKNQRELGASRTCNIAPRT